MGTNLLKMENLYNMENKWIYIDEITTLHADDDGVCLSNEYNSITINPHTLVDWLPNIIEVALEQKQIMDAEKIVEIKNSVKQLRVQYYEKT